MHGGSGLVKQSNKYCQHQNKATCEYRNYFSIFPI